MKYYIAYDDNGAILATGYVGGDQLPESLPNWNIKEVPGPTELGQTHRVNLATNEIVTKTDMTLSFDRYLVDSGGADKVTITGCAAYPGLTVEVRQRYTDTKDDIPPTPINGDDTLTLSFVLSGFYELFFNAPGYNQFWELIQVRDRI